MSVMQIIAIIHVLKCFLLSSDQDGWLGEFSAGQEYPLLWKEGEVYLLPLTEEDIGFYKAPGESERKIIEIWVHPWRQIVTLGWVKWVGCSPQEAVLVLLTFMLLDHQTSSCCSSSKYVNGVSVSSASLIPIACSCCSLVRLIRFYGSGSCGSYSDTVSSNPLSEPLEDKGLSWPSYRI